MRALVVEGDPTNRRKIAALLKSMGFDVTSVQSVAEARWMLAISLPAALILNLSLPDGSGIEILRLIRQQGWNISTAVFSTAGDPMLVESIKLRPETVLETPGDLTTLRCWLTGVLERRSLGSETATEGP